MDTVHALRWLLELPGILPPDLSRALRDTPLPVVGTHHDQVHLAQGCTTARELTPTDRAVSTLPLVALHRALDDPDVQLCAPCLAAHLETNIGRTRLAARRPRHLGDVMALGEHAVALYRLTRATQIPQLSFTDVPWESLCHVAWKAPLPPDSLRTALHARMDQEAAALHARISAHTPHWLWVRHAVVADHHRPWRHTHDPDATRVSDRLISRRSDWDGLHELVDDLVRQVAEVVASAPTVPVLVPARQLVAQAGLLPVLEHSQGHGLLAAPAPYAAMVAFDGVVYGLPAGWEHDQLTRQRLRTAATLWEPHGTDRFHSVADAFEAACALVPT